MIDAAYVTENFLDVVPGRKCLRGLTMKGEAIKDVTRVLVRREYGINTRSTGHNASSRCLDGFKILFILG